MRNALECSEVKLFKWFSFHVHGMVLFEYPDLTEVF